jgi:hypothetical protein
MRGDGEGEVDGEGVGMGNGRAWEFGTGDCWKQETDQ